LTEAAEPPLLDDASVPERPCTVILSEHPELYNGSSWHEVFQRRFPAELGMTYRRWSMDPTKTENVDDALNQLLRDLAGVPDAVLVARGPWMSWISQFFLESLPLKGLIMVDPVPLDDKQGIEHFQGVYKSRLLEESLEYKLFQDYANHWGHWTLRLEPGSVPMLVLYSLPHVHVKSFALKTAQRHVRTDDGSEGEVPAVALSNSDSDRQVDEAVAVVSDWILEKVL
jgi:hypothetical protein